MFVTTMLGGSMTALGFLDGIGVAIVSFSQALSGYLSDRYNRRKIFIWTGYLCGSFSRIGYAFASFWTHLIPFRILDRFGKIRSAPRDAQVSDLSNYANRGSNFGLLRAMDHGGAVIGIILCIILFEKIGYRNLFLLAAIPSVIGAIGIVVFVRERGGSVSNKLPGIRWHHLSREYKLFLALSAVFALSTFSYSFLLIYAKQFGFTSSFIPVLYLAFTIVASISSVPFGRLTNRIGRKLTFFISQACWFAVCLILLLSSHYYAVWACFILYGLHLGALEPVQKTLAAELSPSNQRASGIGLYQMTLGICALPASLVAGYLWESINLFIPLWVSLILTLVSMILLYFLNIR
jgi:MFS family permease